MKQRVISATEFKAKCLSVLDEVHANSESVTITKRGQPVAVVVPSPQRPWKSPKDSLAKKGKIVGDIVNLDTSVLWDVVRDE